MENTNQDEEKQQQQQPTSSIFGLGSFMDEVEEAKVPESSAKSADEKPTKEQFEKMAAQQ